MRNFFSFLLAFFFLPNYNKNRSLPHSLLFLRVIYRFNINGVSHAEGAAAIATINKSHSDN